MADTLYDTLGSFGQGINSGVDPLLLAKNQAAFADNGTFRGDFLRTLPAFKTISLSYASSLIQTGFQAGWFQGAGYYKPDYGSESIPIAVAGRIYLFTPDNSGGGVISEITIPGDPNPSTPQQGWFCQAENFLIWNDGLTLPFFYDGANSRRSNGPSMVLGIVSIAATVPVIGGSVNLILNDVYNGPLNQNILIGGANYVVTGFAAGGTPSYGVTLVNLDDTAGDTVASGENLVVQPANLGKVVSSAAHSTTIPYNGLNYPAVDIVITAPVPAGLPAGNSGQVSIEGVNAFVNSKSGNAMTVFSLSVFTVNNGDTVTWVGNNSPNVTVATLAAGFDVPAVGSPVDVVLSLPYTGAVGQVVFIGTGQYQITAVSNVTPPTGNQIIVENLSDTAGNTIPVGTELTTLPELPAGRMLVYEGGRVNEALTDARSFIIGDIEGGSSGSPTYDFRDSVLKITETLIFSNGGKFRVPSSGTQIQAMSGIALLDNSLGQGPVQIFTNNTVFSCNLPTDRSTWQSLTTPILPPSVIGAGGAGQEAVSLSNGDLIFRSSDGLIRSLLMARLDFNQWGNTPISREVDRILAGENPSLLNYSTTADFDNRFIMGAGLQQSPRGVYSTRMVALNFDPISSLRGKDPAIYDGQWDGLNILQLVEGFFNGVDRCFAICLSSDLTQIEIHEILTTDASTVDDTSTPIALTFESPVLFNYLPSQNNPKPSNPGHNYLQLSYGEIYVDSLVGDTGFQAFYKPDQWPSWVPWYSWTEKYNPEPKQGDPGFRPRIGLPAPEIGPSDETNARPLREGFCFQFKLVITGKCRFLGGGFSAEIKPQPKFAKPTFNSP